MDSISFQSKKYNTREILLPDFGDVLISTVQLNSDLFDQDDNYVSLEATFIDEQIFYFVEENEITLPEESLRSLLIKQVR